MEEDDYYDEDPRQLRDAVITRILNLSDGRKISLKDACRKAGLSYDTLMSFIDGRTRIINIDTLSRICYGFGVTFEEFFTDPIFDYIIDEYERKTPPRSKDSLF